MKKLSIIYGLALVLALGARPSLAAKFQLDFYGGNTSYVKGDFETSITIREGDTIYVDLWCTGIPPGQLVSAIDTELHWPTDSIEIVSIDNTFLFPQPATGIWDGAPYSPLGPGKYFLEVILFSGGNPGPDIQMQTIEFRCISEGTDWVKVTVGDVGAIYDENSEELDPPEDCEVTVYQISATKTTTTLTGSTTTSTITSTTTSTITNTSTVPTTTTIISTTSSISSTTSTVINNCLFKRIYGENSEKVEILRDFRDNVLSKTTEGMVLIRLYYEWSPAIVKMMACALPDCKRFRSGRHADRE